MPKKLTDKTKKQAEKMLKDIQKSQQLAVVGGGMDMSKKKRAGTS